MKTALACALFAFCWISACRPNDEPQQPATPTQTCKLTAIGALYPALDFASPSFYSRFSQDYEYDAQGKLKKLFINSSSDTAKRISLTIERDAQGRMAKVIYKNQGLVGSYYVLSYDGTGSLPVSSKQFVASYPSGEFSPSGEETFEYNSSKKVAFSGNRSVGYEYDSRGNPTRLKANPGQANETVLVEFKSFDDKTNPFSLNEDVQFLHLRLYRIPPMTNNPTSWITKSDQVNIVYTYNAIGQPATFKGTRTNLNFPDQKIPGDEQAITYMCK